MTTIGVPPALPRPKKPRGCLFYGCMTALVLLVVGGVGGFFAIRYALDMVVEVVEPYTEATPMQLPESKMPAAEYQLLERRVDDFRGALAADQQPAPLVLTSDDLNALIANHPAWSMLRGKVHVSLQGDQVEGEIAFPLDDFIEHLPRMARLKGRYLNGTATLRIALVDEILVVALRSLTVKGQSLPPEVLANLRSHNLVDMTRTGSPMGELESEFETIEVADGKLTLEARPKR